MAVSGSGLFTQLGFAPEVSYGTIVPPTRFFEVPDGGESIKQDLERMASSGLQVGRRVQRNNRRIGYAKGAGGELNFDLPTRDAGFLLKYCTGKIVTSQPAVGPSPLVFDHTATIDDLKTAGSFTCQVGRPDVGATVRPFTYYGGVVTDWEIANAVEEILKLKLTTDFQGEDTATALAVPSYTAEMGLLTFIGGIVTLAGSAFDVKGCTVSGKNAMDTERRFIRQDVKKKQPIENGMREISGSLDAEFVDLTAYNRAVANTEASIVLKWEGAILQNAFKETLQITIPVAQFDGETPTSDDKGILNQSLPFTVVDDGTQEPITILYRTKGATP